MLTTAKNRILFTFIAIAVLFNTAYAQFYQWSSIGSGTSNGTNGVVNAITKYNGNIVVGGYFSSAGTTSVSNVALYNGSTWSSLGGGVDDTVYALAVFGGNLYAAGKFSQAEGYPASKIAKWNGTSWSALGTGLNGNVYALAVYNGNLIAGGKFSNAGNNIASWNGTVWTNLSQGTNDTVYALSVTGSFMYAGGSFTTAGGVSANRIAEWNGSAWFALGTGMNSTVLTLSSYGSNLAAGGKFTSAGGVNALYVAEWTGSSWLSLGFNLDNYVTSLAYYNNALIVGGQFANVSLGSGALFVNHICKWDASGCTRMISGTNRTIRTLFTGDSSLYAGGDFSAAGGDPASGTAIFSNVPTHTISGIVKYADNNLPLTSGVVKAVRLDFNTKEIIVIDSASVQTNGAYQIPRGFGDSTFIVAFPNDELADRFAPTYYPSTLDWAGAVRIYPSNNLTNIDINVVRTSSNGTSLSNISGHVRLNLSPLFQPGFPYSKGAVVYAKQGNTFVHFAVSDSTEKYTLTGLAPGTYTLTVNRIGYKNASRTVTLGTINLDTINFSLDTADVIGIENISSTVPQGFRLFQNYPNPFNPVTIINFDIKKRSFVSLTIYNITGQQVERLVNEELSAGEYRVSFNASGKPSGVYFYELSTAEFSETKKMILIK